jgi:hypothetical protein
MERKPKQIRTSTLVLVLVVTAVVETLAGYHFDAVGSQCECWLHPAYNLYWLCVGTFFLFMLKEEFFSRKKK